MKLNNKGFAITAVLYGLLILFVVLVSSHLLVLSAKKDRVNDLVNDIESDYLENNRIENGNKEYIDFTITKYNRYMIGYTDEINDLVIPSTFQTEDGTWYKVVEIASDTFHDCDNLNSVTIPDSVITIGPDVFLGCKNLSSIVIPRGIKTIESGAFNNCPNISNIYYKGTEEEWNDITIHNDNFDSLANAVIHYNFVSN